MAWESGPEWQKYAPYSEAMQYREVLCKLLSAFSRDLGCDLPISPQPQACNHVSRDKTNKPKFCIILTCICEYASKYSNSYFSVILLFHVVVVLGIASSQAGGKCLFFLQHRTISLCLLTSRAKSLVMARRERN